MKAILKVALALLFFAALNVGLVHAWSNGGYSTDSANPKYGTHDWIAQHALDWLPTQEKQYIANNLQAYLLGTELPDNDNASLGGIGDTQKHHVYFSSDGQVTDDASAQRAAAEYTTALNCLKTQDYVDAAKAAGAMSHYIDDMGVFGHVMGSSTPWGTETHHSDYEDYVNDRTNTYVASFDKYLLFDGSLSTITAYKATVNLAYDTTFGGSSLLTCVWMDENYNWSNPTFADRCGQSLNLAVNAVADVLHTLYQEAGSPTTTPAASQTPNSTTTQPTATTTPYPTVPMTTPELPVQTAIVLLFAASAAAGLAATVKRRKTTL